MEIRRGVQGLVRSNHLVVPVPPSILAKPQPKYASFHDIRDPCKIAITTKLSAFSWNSINNSDNPGESMKLLDASLWLMFNKSSLLITSEYLPETRPTCSPWYSIEIKLPHIGTTKQRTLFVKRKLTHLFTWTK